MIASALLVHGVPVECINQAAITYVVPAKVIISILATEGGKVGSATLNKNKTEDLGPMQINTSWLTQLATYGVTREQVQYDPCINVMVGTWILSNKITQTASDSGDYWRGVAGYNSITPAINAKYQSKVRSNYQVLSDSLGEAT
jgi:soluble lytic murein transglycosylase-like protein